MQDADWFDGISRFGIFLFVAPCYCPLHPEICFPVNRVGREV